jgi:hypothetical protein
VPGAQTLLNVQIAAGVAISAWLSMGVVAVTGLDTRARLLAVPPWWVLVAFVVAAVLVVGVMKPRPSRLWPLGLLGLLWLPFVPGHVPAALLIWQGPIEIGIWIVALAGPVAWPERAAMPTLRSDGKAAPWVAAATAAIAFAGGAAWLHERQAIGDEPHYLVITQSILKDADLQIENNHQQRDYAAFASGELPPHYVARGTNGQIYSVHAPGVSMLVLPAFALLGFWGAVATVALCAALAAGLAWHAAWVLTRDPLAAWIGWAAVCLSAPFFLHAVAVFPDAAGAVFVMAGVWLLIGLDAGVIVGPRLLVLVGAALAVLPWLHTRFAVLAASIGLAVTIRLAVQRPARAATFLAVPAVAAFAWFGFFWTIWGTPDPSAPYGALTSSRMEWIPRGVSGLLLDPQMGLIGSAPGYLMAAVGLGALAASRPRLAFELAAIAGSYLLVVAAYEMWWGGFGGPARFLVATLPIAAPLVAAAAVSGVGRRVAPVLVLISALLLTARLTANGGTTAYTADSASTPSLEWLAPSVDLARGWSTLRPASSQAEFLRSWTPGWHTRLDAQPLSLDGSALLTGRFGSIQVYFLDVGVYAEPSGFWLPPHRSTSMVVEGEDPSRGFTMHVQSGPVATAVEVTIDGRASEVTLAPHSRSTLTAPPGVGGWSKLTVRTGDGFRPADHDPASGDRRDLGVWIELAQ